MDETQREARRAYDRARYAREAERRKAHAKQYKEANAERLKEKRKQYVTANREKVLQAKRDEYKRNADTYREYARLRRATQTEDDRDKLAKWRKEHRAKKPEIYRESWLRNQYGISQSEWDTLFDKQGRVCAVCGTDDPGGSKGWHTDHCHKEGHVRGILCRTCNTGLGKFKDCPDQLLKAHAYLSRKE